jgi:hypothetical protein
VLDIITILNITMSYDIKTRDGLLEQVYDALAFDTSLDSIHIPHSDVFYVRAALEARFKCELSLLQAEEYMKEAGWTDGSSTRESEEQDEGVGA